MDLGKYVAVGVLAVIVLAAVTYEAPKDGRRAANDPTRVEGTFGPAPSAPAGPTGPPSALPTQAPEPAAAPAPVTTSAPSGPASHVPRTLEGAAARLPELLHHTVKAGQTLRDVAQELLGDRRRWQEIARVNKDRLPDPDLLREGMDLIFPREQARPAAPASPSAPSGAAATTVPAGASGGSTTVAASAGGRSYTVSRGDTLFSIARRELGAGGRWKEIKSLNGLTSDQVVAGTVLRLPAR